jgi:hypothetical protein
MIGESFIRGYKAGDNISLLNVIYHKPRKIITEDGRTTRTKDSIDIIYKDLNTGEKKLQHIVEPTYTYWMTNEGVPVDYNKLYIEKNNVHPIECKYTDLKKSIAENTGNLEYFYDNIRNGNYRENEKLFTIPSVFNADMNIEDYYRWLFARTYQNNNYTPTKLYFDIETDGIDMAGDFPEMGECPVNAITLVDDTGKHVYTLLLENPKNPLIEEFKNTPNLTNDLKDFVRESVGGWKKEHKYGLQDFDYHIMYYDEEAAMIHDAFSVINTIKPDFALAWNIAFDLPYLIARIQTLGYDPTEFICHPDFKDKECYYYIDSRSEKFEERGDYACISCYTVYLDQLITFASRRKGQRAVSNYKLDYIGGRFAGVNKLDYSNITTSVIKLPYLDYHTFVFYNVMDTIVQLCIEHSIGDVDFVFTKSLTTNVRYSKVHRQTTYLANRFIANIWDMGYVAGNNVNKNNPKSTFAGAFVADPLNVSDKPKMKINGRPVMICDNLNDFDYKSMYPWEINQNNISPPTQHGKILLPEKLDPKENRFNNEYFDRVVYFSEDYLCGNPIVFCERYLRLAGYEQMADDIIEYFTTIKAPIRGLRSHDSVSGKRIMVNIIPKGQKRTMVSLVDKSKKRTMCIISGKMVHHKWT